MNNKGFNWFFPIAIIALLLFFASNFLGDNNVKTIDEDGFFREMQAGKIQKVLIDKQSQTADVYLTKASKSATVDTNKKIDNPFSGMAMTPGADYSLKYGDLTLFLQKFEEIKKLILL